MPQELTLHRECFQAMGSVCELQIYAASTSDFDDICFLVKDAVHQFELKYSRYVDTSVISEINRSSGSAAGIEIDTQTSALLQYADALFKQSQGLFDITSGALRKAWNFREPPPPSAKKIEEALQFVDWKQVQLSEAYIRLPIAGMEIDFGGFGKEYCVDYCAQLCREQGIEHGLLNFGGDMVILGPHPDGQTWCVGIQHPRDKGAIAKLLMSRGALATSGDYERFFEYQGRRYCHLLDPRNGESIDTNFTSVSVVADTCLLAGSVSTIAMLLSGDNAQWVQETGLEYLTINKNLEVRHTIKRAKVESDSLKTT